jgi:hypothetical protein
MIIPNKSVVFPEKTLLENFVTSLPPGAKDSELLNNDP